MLLLSSPGFSGMKAHALVNFMGFQLVSPGLVVGSPRLQFGLLDEGSCGWKHGFGFFVGYDFEFVGYYPCFI